MQNVISVRHVSTSCVCVCVSPLYVILVHLGTSFQHVMSVRHLNTSCDCWLDAALVFVCCFRCLPPFGHAYVLVKLQNLTVSSRCDTRCVLYTQELSHSFHLLFPFFMSTVCLPLCIYQISFYWASEFNGLSSSCQLWDFITQEMVHCLVETFLSFVCCSCCLLPFIQLYTQVSYFFCQVTKCKSLHMSIVDLSSLTSANLH